MDVPYIQLDQQGLLESVEKIYIIEETNTKLQGVIYLKKKEIDQDVSLN